MFWFFFSLILLISADNPCPQGTHLFRETVCLTPLSVDSFYAAELTCLQLGGHLPAVFDDDCNQAIAKEASLYFSGCDSMWLGMDSRGDWLNGQPDSDYRNFPDNTTFNNLNQCVVTSLSTAFWSWTDCSKKLPYMCAFSPLFDVSQTDQPMQHCSLQSTIPDFKTDLKQVQCTISTHQCSNWNVAVMIGLKLEQSTTSVLEKLNETHTYLNTLVGGCGNESTIQFFTPWAPQNSCGTKNINQGAVNTFFDNVVPSKVQYLNGKDEDVETLNMFEAFRNCSDYEFDKNSSFGGVVYFFTDLVCDDVCTPAMMENQHYLIDNLTENGYNVRFIRLGNDSYESDCFHEIFNRCTQYNPNICDIHGFSSLKMAQSNSNEYFCPAPSSAKDKGGSGNIVVIIISSIVAFLIIVACVGIRCFFRYKSLKQGNKWSWFVWKSPEDGTVPTVTNGKTFATPNEYGELNREPDPWEILPENLFYSDNDILGSGAFATVYLGHLKGEIPLAKMNNGAVKLGLRKEADGTYMVAVKRLPPHATAEGRSDFSHEIEFMKDLGYHPHVLSLFGVVNSTHDALIVIENCEHGDLLTYIRNKKETFVTTEPETIDFSRSILRVKDLISIAWQISDGMSYLASKNFIHRDIAARNILLTRSMVAKIGDFGLCRLVDSSLYTAKGGRLPIKWMAPESLKYYEYSLKSDIWSFAVLLFELFSLGEAPYGTVQPSDMPKYLDEGNRLPQPDTCPNEIYEIMTKCWEKDSDLRPTIDDIREELTVLLNNDSSSYGYLSIHDIDDQEVCEI